VGSSKNFPRGRDVRDVRWAYVSALALLLVVGASCSGKSNHSTGSPIAPVSQTPSSQQGSQGAPNIVAAVAIARPAVVQITNEQLQLDRFNQPFNIPAGVGSGIVYDVRGYILTNNHVIQGAQRLLVTLPDGRSFPARLIGTDPYTDVAVIKVESANLPLVILGDADKLAVGEWVVAIGNALALRGGPTVSAGVVSATGRTVQEPGNSYLPGPFLFDLIQTSAPINPGNSGGALVNLAGEVIGINTLVAGEAEPGVQAQGIGFAIPINDAKEIADELVAKGRAIHAYLGASYTTLTPAIASQQGTTLREGVVITNTVPGSPAAILGLKRGDILVQVDGKPVQTDSDLAKIIDSHQPGDTIALTLGRGSGPVTARLNLGDTPSP
jgi:S1-C subfamily serine protease